MLCRGGRCHSNKSTATSLNRLGAEGIFTLSGRWVEVGGGVGMEEGMLRR